MPRCDDPFSAVMVTMQFVALIVTIMILAMCDATVNTTQYNNAVVACEHAGGLDTYEPSIQCSNGCMVAYEITCKDGRKIDQWPPFPAPSGDAQ